MFSNIEKNIRKPYPFLKYDNIFYNSETNNDSDTCEYHTNQPESHHNGFLTPSDCFKMMMKWSNTKNLFSISEFLASNLNNYRKGFKNKETSSNQEYS